MQVERGFDDLKGPGMHFNRARPCLGVEPTDVARLIMKAHEVVHRGDGVECRLDARMHRAGCGTRDADLHECTEQRSRPANAI
jgi:hypothetical protein